MPFFLFLPYFSCTLSFWFSLFFSVTFIFLLSTCLSIVSDFSLFCPPFFLFVHFKMAYPLLITLFPLSSFFFNFILTFLFSPPFQLFLSSSSFISFFHGALFLLFCCLWHCLNCYFFLIASPMLNVASVIDISPPCVYTNSAIFVRIVSSFRCTFTNWRFCFLSLFLFAKFTFRFPRLC